jgi:hypothetical protein
MKMKKRLLVLAAALMTLAPLGASAAVFMGGGYGRPYWGPGYYGGYAYAYAGEVKLHTKVKNAEVFINGAFAGDTQHNKSMHLRPGTYNLEIREAGHPRFSQRLYVVAGKTLHLHPEL